MSGTAEGPGDGAWRCPQCGTANPAGVTECLHCGESSVGGRPVKPKVRPLVIVAKLLCAVGVGVLVFGVSAIAAFHAFRTSASYVTAGQVTLGVMGEVRQAIEAYLQEHQELPDSLRDLSPDEGAWLRGDERGAFLDGWQRPLQYSTDGTEYELMSYGRDGRPGGVGLDTDLSTADLPEGEAAEQVWPPPPDRALATFEQFAGDQGESAETGSGYEMFRTCIVAGVVAFLVALVALNRSRTRGSFILSLVLTTAGALLVGVVMSALHIPTDH